MGIFDSNKFNRTKVEWETPQSLFDRLNKEFGFTCDLAANQDNAKVSTFIDENVNALTVPWSGICWLNPPYDGKLRKWVEKAFRDARDNKATVVMLIPAKTNTNWWHLYCMNAKEIRFIKGRPKFVGAKHGLPFPLALIVFSAGDYFEPIFSTYEV